MGQPATAKPLIKALQERRALVKEYLEIEKKRAPDEPRRKEIRSLLIGMATDGKFQDTIVELGRVSVSPARPERTEGKTYEIVDLDRFMALPKKRREAIMKKAGIAEVSIVKEAYEGRVTPTLFSKA